MHLVFDFVVLVVSNTFGSGAGLGAVPVQVLVQILEFYIDFLLENILLLELLRTFSLALINHTAFLKKVAFAGGVLTLLTSFNLSTKLLCSLSVSSNDKIVSFIFLKKK